MRRALLLIGLSMIGVLMVASVFQAQARKLDVCGLQPR
jgi:hypothetical protein